MYLTLKCRRLAGLERKNPQLVQGTSVAQQLAVHIVQTVFGNVGLVCSESTL